MGAFLVCFFLFQNQLLYLFFSFSVLGFLLGICYALKKNKLGYLSCGIGVSGIITYVIYIKEILDIYACVTFMICLSVSLTLFLTLFFFCLTCYLRKHEYSHVVEGEVIELIRKNNEKKEFYKPVYIYSVNDVSYKVEYIKYIKYFIPNIGDKKKLYLYPTDPLNVYFMPERIEIIVNILTCLTFIIMPIFILVGLF